MHLFFKSSLRLILVWTYYYAGVVVVYIVFALPESYLVLDLDRSILCTFSFFWFSRLGSKGLPFHLFINYDLAYLIEANIEGSLFCLCHGILYFSFW